MKELLNFLAQSFPPEDIKTREQAGITLHYVERQTVANRLDEAIIQGLCVGWESRFEFGPNGEIICSIGIVDNLGRAYWRSDGAEQTKIESVKGGITDAFKRAADMWGVARYLREGELPQRSGKTAKKSGKSTKTGEKSVVDQYQALTIELGWSTKDRSKHIAEFGGDVEAALADLENK